MNTNSDQLYTAEDFKNYKEITDHRVSKIVRNGQFHYGTFLKALDRPRRGWIVRGIPYFLAETSLEHSRQLKNAGAAYCSNHDSDISYSVVMPMFETHDHIDSVFIDIIPKDK